MLELTLYVYLFELIDMWISGNLRKQLSSEPINGFAVVLCH